jgi:hypothetical protein
MLHIERSHKGLLTESFCVKYYFEDLLRKYFVSPQKLVNWLDLIVFVLRGKCTATGMKHVTSNLFVHRQVKFNGTLHATKSCVELKSTKYLHCFMLIYTKLLLTLSDPTSDLVRQYDFPVLLRCRKTSDTVLLRLCAAVGACPTLFLM